MAVVCNMGLLKHIFPEVLKHLELKIYKDFETCKVFMHNFYAKLI